MARSMTVKTRPPSSSALTVLFSGVGIICLLVSGLILFYGGGGGGEYCKSQLNFVDKMRLLVLVLVLFYWKPNRLICLITGNPMYKRLPE